MILMILIGNSWLITLAALIMRYDNLCSSIRHSLPVNVTKSHDLLYVNLQVMSAKNKANKAKQRIKHTSGSKSFLATSYDAVRFLLNVCSDIV